jgi:hypothetical protein
MTGKQKVLASGVALATAFAVGRYTVPEKVKIETKVVEVEKIVKVKDKRKERKVVTITRPDGTKEKTSHTVEDTKTDERKDVAKNEETKSETVRGASKVTISALGGVDFRRLGSEPFVVGASVTKPMVGPVTFGVFGLSNLTFGVSAGLTF